MYSLTSAKAFFAEAKASFVLAASVCQSSAVSLAFGMASGGVPFGGWTMVGTDLASLAAAAGRSSCWSFSQTTNSLPPKTFFLIDAVPMFVAAPQF